MFRRGWGQWALIVGLAVVGGATSVVNRVLGPAHPDTLSSRNNYGFVLANLGMVEEAEREFRVGLDHSVRVLDPDHPETLASGDGLARVLAARGESDTA